MTGIEDLVAELEARSAAPPATPGLTAGAVARGRRMRRNRRLAGAGAGAVLALAGFAALQNLSGTVSLRPVPPATQPPSPTAAPSPTGGWFSYGPRSNVLTQQVVTPGATGADAEAILIPTTTDIVLRVDCTAESTTDSGTAQPVMISINGRGPVSLPCGGVIEDQFGRPDARWALFDVTAGQPMRVRVFDPARPGRAIRLTVSSDTPAGTPGRAATRPTALPGDSVVTLDDQLRSETVRITPATTRLTSTMFVTGTWPAGVNLETVVNGVPILNGRIEGDGAISGGAFEWATGEPLRRAGIAPGVPMTVTVRLVKDGRPYTGPLPKGFAVQSWLLEDAGRP